MDRVDPLLEVRGQGDVDRADIRPQLLHGGGADDRGGHKGAGIHEGDGELGRIGERYAAAKAGTLTI